MTIKARTKKATAKTITENNDEDKKTTTTKATRSMIVRTTTIRRMTTKTMITDQDQGSNSQTSLAQFGQVLKQDLKANCV